MRHQPPGRRVTRGRARRTSHDACHRVRGDPGSRLPRRASIRALTRRAHAVSAPMSFVPGGQTTGLGSGRRQSGAEGDRMKRRSAPSAKRAAPKRAAPKRAAPKRAAPRAGGPRRGRCARAPARSRGRRRLAAGRRGVPDRRHRRLGRRARGARAVPPQRAREERHGLRRRPAPGPDAQGHAGRAAPARHAHAGRPGRPIA